MTAFELWSIVFSGLAVLISVITAACVAIDARRAAKRADVTAYFHWLPATARIRLASGGAIDTGYHLVLRNRGPADAQEVTVKVAQPDGGELQLVSIDPNEFPLSTLDAGSRYPIPFALAGGVHEGKSGYRRFVVTLTWRDGGGKKVNTKRIPLRRGQTGGAGD